LIYAYPPSSRPFSLALCPFTGHENGQAEISTRPELHIDLIGSFLHHTFPIPNIKQVILSKTENYYVTSFEKDNEVKIWSTYTGGLW